ncbi:serine hydrolase domain-containing protein [Psychromonas aquatilis]|uniref:Serine hydrolase domain-containing protein n=1 Tax=Psychromonas aquatilis TaxID=2005072 RepID=A0ABU9GRD4_9GAMM
MKRLIHPLLLLALTLSPMLAASEQSVEALIKRMPAGKLTENILFLNDQDRRIAFTHFDQLVPTRLLPASSHPYPLQDHADPALKKLTYSVEGKTFSIEELLQQKELMGMIVVKGDNILLEHYAEDHSPESVWVSFSITKSFNATLIGAAIKDGYIVSLDDTVADYLPRLKGSDYGKSTIRHILQMASGIAWNEDYSDPESDVAKAGALQGVALTRYLSKLKRVHPAGEVFNYNTAEANLIGEILRSAIGNSATAYMNAKIWKQFGMEHDANWMLNEVDGQETGGCCISATLRDYARLGIFAKRKGELPSGENILPAGWMEMATAASSVEPHYGYQWWIKKDGAYAAAGIFGQMIYVHPKSDLVIAIQSNASAAVATEYHKNYQAAADAIAQYYTGQ